jgi:hypothetical protein
LGWVGRENILAENESGTPTSNPISDLVALNPLSDSARDELDRMAWTVLFLGGGWEVGLGWTRKHTR